MRISTLSAITVLGVIVSVQPALAASCYDLWYERNAIYNDNGYCFSTQLGQETFDNSDCYTSDVQLSRSEQRRVDSLKNQEDNRGCNVN
ncbi:MAG: hypothetical protein JWM58_2215 [Rhizobium sp.]|nr:hypothetical protein [Rhizobium sp.]